MPLPFLFSALVLRKRDCQNNTMSSSIIPAATLILLRDGPTGLETFMVVRHHQIDFASGALVFPGGKVDPDDEQLVSDNQKRMSAAVMSTDASLQDPVGRIAAIRETYEEAGLLFARRAPEPGLLPSTHLTALAKRREQLLAGQIRFADFLIQEKLQLAWDCLIPFARWIGPPIAPKRFDTMFYVAQTPLDQLGSHDGYESVDSIWINPVEACRDSDAGHRTIIFPTRKNLERLAQFVTVSEVLEAAKAQPLVPVEPFVEEREGQKMLCIREDAGYPITCEPLATALRG